MVSFSPPTNSITVSIIISILWIKRPSKKNMLIFSTFWSFLLYPVLCHHRGVYVLSLQEQNFQCSTSKFTLLMRSTGLLLPGYQFINSAHIWMPAWCPHLCQGQGPLSRIPVVNAGRGVHSMWWEHWQRMSQSHQWHQSPPYLSAFLLPSSIWLNCLPLHPSSPLGLYKTLTIWT